MAEETIILLMLITVMLVGSYIAGSIPLIMKLSEEKLKFVTVLGAGLLVGTALTVIIPEGIRSLYTEVIVKKEIMPASLLAVTFANADITKVTKLHHKHHSNEIPDHSRTIGFSLILGFVFMMLIDQISQRRHSASSANDKDITTTLGLVVHAAADGVALGAAATTSHQDVEIIVFLAIMLHKAPAAFGLVSFLLHEKIDRQKIRRHLAIFSLSAPLLTLLTYFGIGQEQKETLNSVNATGIAMLFSAGTFLYVATVHVLPELTQGAANHVHSRLQHDYRQLEGAPDTDILIRSSHQHITTKGLRCSELVIMICGSLLPLFITLSHQH
uniref:Uncharacterized protein n=1 Tax=Glossina morsitans morsitans TaxID=37546 RepID=A0A1B0GBN4_GLOMM